jgi:hypothetical protein
LRKFHPQNTSAKHTRDRPIFALLSIANLRHEREFDSFVPSHNFKNYRDTMPCRSRKMLFYQPSHPFSKSENLYESAPLQVECCALHGSAAHLVRNRLGNKQVTALIRMSWRR